MSILVYTKPGCGECGQAKTLITLKGDTYQEVNLSSPQLMEGFKENFPAVRQMPHIIINGIEINGLKGLKEYYDNRKQLLTES
jgi:glutaredoxin